jgi:hypothetical protein
MRERARVTLRTVAFDRGLCPCSRLFAGKAERNQWRLRADVEDWRSADITS